MVKAQSTMASRTNTAIQRDRCLDIVSHVDGTAPEVPLDAEPRSVGLGRPIGDIKIGDDGPMIAGSPDIR